MKSVRSSFPPDLFATTKTLRRLPLGVFLAAIAALSIVFRPTDSNAQSFPTWTGGAGTANFGDTSNWSGGNFGSYGQAQFTGGSGGGGTTLNNNTGSSQSRIYFSGATAYTLNGNDLSLFDYGSPANWFSWLLSDSTVNQTINANLNFAATSGSYATFGQISARSSGNLTFQNIGITGSNVSQLRFAGQSSGKIIVNGAVTGSGKDVLIGLDETAGDRTSTDVTFNGNNTYSGVTYVVAGSLRLGSSAVLSTSSIQLGQTSGTSAGTLSLESTSGGQSYSTPITIRSGSSGTKTINSAATSGNNTLSGSITANDNFTVTSASGGNLIFSGVISGANGFVKAGNGTLILSGASANTFSGGNVDVNAGTLVLNKTANVTAIQGRPVNIASGATVRTDAAGQIGSAPLVTVNGTLNLNGNNQTIALAGSSSGNVTLGSGTLTISNTGNDTFSGTISGTGAVAKAGNGTQILNGTNTYNGTTTISGGFLQIGTGGTTGSLGSGNVTNNATLTFNRSDSVTISNAISGSGKVAIAGGGTIVFNDTKTFTGDTYIMNGATLKIGAASGSSTVRLGGDFGTTGLQNLGQGATLTLTSSNGSQTFGGIINTVGSNTSNALLIDSQNTSGTNTLSANSYLDSALRTQVASGGSLLFQGGTIDFKGQTLTVDGAGNTTLNENLFSSTSNATTNGGSLIKKGAGTLIIQSTGNSYSGSGANALNANSTQINQGTLGIYGDTSLGIAPQNAYNNIQFTGNGTLQDTANNISLNATRNINVASGVTATFDSNGNTLTINGVVNGTGGNVAKTGSGTVNLSGNNTFTGTTTVSNGTLELAATGGKQALASTSNVTVSTGGTLLLSQGNQINDSATVTLGGGQFQLNGAFSETAGALTLSANSTIDFGSGFGASTLTFGSYTGNSKLLTVSNFGVGDVLILGGDVTGSLSNTSLFSFSGGFTSSFSSGATTITAVPEPSTIAAGLSLLGLVCWRERRRFARFLAVAGFAR